VSPRHPSSLIALSAVCFALMGLATKIAAAHLSGPQISTARFALMLILVLALPKIRRRAATFERWDLLLYRGVFGGVAALLYFVAIEHVPIGIATLLNFTAPVFSVAFASIFLGERFEPKLVLPVLVVAAGVPLAAGAEPRGLAPLAIGRWELVALGSAVLAGAAVTSIRAARRTENSWSIFASFSLFGFLAALPLTAARPLEDIPPAAWLWVVAVGVTSIGAQLLMTFAYRWVTNLQAGVILQLTVVLSLVLGALVLGERMTPLQLLGSGLTLAGVLGVIALHAPPRAVA
jgi:drug/metabolite transporter (DMT)-like permease